MNRIESNRSYITMDIKHFDNMDTNMDSYDNNINDNNLSTYKTEDLKRKLMYQLQRNL
jgi:hypothetical protein